MNRAIVYGGGPIGIKAAYALLQKGIPVSIVVSSGQILSRVLDTKAAAIFQTIFEQHGGRFYCNSEMKDIVNRKGCKGVIINRGEEITGDVLIVGKGVTPDMVVLKDSGIMTHEGVLVDERMETNIQGVYAAGDVAEADLTGRKGKAVVSLWPVGASQGRIAGANMAGMKKFYEGSINSNSIEYFGLQAISMGILQGVNLEERTFEENGVYRRFFFENRRLVGAVLVGNVEGAGILMEAIRRELPIQDQLTRLALDPFPTLSTANSERGTDRPVKMEVLF